MYVIWGHKEVISGRPFWWNSQRGRGIDWCGTIFRNTSEREREGGREGEIRIYLVSRLWLIVKFRASVFRQHNDWWCMERKLEGNHTLQTREADVTFAQAQIAPDTNKQPAFFPLKYTSCIAWAPLKIHNLSNAAGQQRAFGKTPYRISALLLFVINVNTQLLLSKISIVNICEKGDDNF